LWVLKPAMVCRWAMDRRVEGPLVPWKRLKEVIDLIRWLGHTPRAVGAWWICESSLHRQRFDELEEVRLRKNYVDLGNNRDIEGWVEQVGRRKQDLRARWVCGPGGYGKSTLAIRMAREVMGSAAVRGCSPKHWPCAPVLVGKNWDGELTDFLLKLLAP